MNLAYCCEVCDDRDPHWQITRTGDVVVSWACDDHLGAVCSSLQRHDELTEVTVTDFRKAREWAAISRSLEKIAKDPEGEASDG